VNLLILLEVIAMRIKPYQKVSYFFTIVFITLIVMTLILPEQAALIGFDMGSDYGKLGLLGCIWLLLFNIVTRVFIDIPKRVNEGGSLFTRCKLKLRRFFYYILALFFVSLTLVVFILSIRLLRV